MQIHQFGKIMRGDHIGYFCHITPADDETWQLTVFQDSNKQSNVVISEFLPDLEAVNAFLREHDWAIEWPDNETLDDAKHT